MYSWLLQFTLCKCIFFAKHDQLAATHPVLLKLLKFPFLQHVNCKIFCSSPVHQALFSLFRQGRIEKLISLKLRSQDIPTLRSLGYTKKYIGKNIAPDFRRTCTLISGSISVKKINLNYVLCKIIQVTVFIWGFCAPQRLGNIRPIPIPWFQGTIPWFQGMVLKEQ